MQIQIQALLVEGVKEIKEEAAAAAISQSNIGSNINMAKPPKFSGKARQVLGYLMVYRLYISIMVYLDTNIFLDLIFLFF